MSKQKKQSLIATLLIILLIVIDQIIKVVVKLNMNLGESISSIGSRYNLSRTMVWHGVWN